MLVLNLLQLMEDYQLKLVAMVHQPQVNPHHNKVMLVTTRALHHRLEDMVNKPVLLVEALQVTVNREAKLPLVVTIRVQHIINHPVAEVVATIKVVVVVVTAVVVEAVVTVAVVVTIKVVMITAVVVVIAAVVDLVVVTMKTVVVGMEVEVVEIEGKLTSNFLIFQGFLSKHDKTL